MIDAVSLELGSLFHQLMQNLMEGVAISDKRGRLVFANRALEELLGYEPGELTGRPQTILFPARERQWAESIRARTPDATTARHELLLLHKDGNGVPVLASSCPLSDGDGDPVTLFTFTDLRESRHLQAQVQELVRPATMGHHLASIVHELSNSLTIIFLQAQALSKRGSAALTFQNSVGLIRNQTRRMIEMMDSLRASADPYQVQLESTDVNALIEQTLALQGQALQADGIQVITDLDASLPVVETDPYRLQQVFVNLVNNAREAIVTTQRDGTLLVTTWAVTGDDGETPRIQVRFADNGPGIPPEAMAYIFEPFFTTKAGKSMGLGLSICRQIVQKHEGQIWAEQNAMGGATLVVELLASAEPGPRAPSLSDRFAPQVPAVPEPAPPTPSPHTLIVDDEASVAQAEQL